LRFFDEEAVRPSPLPLTNSCSVFGARSPSKLPFSFLRAGLHRLIPFYSFQGPFFPSLFVLVILADGPGFWPGRHRLAVFFPFFLSPISYILVLRRLLAWGRLAEAQAPLFQRLVEASSNGLREVWKEVRGEQVG